MNISNQCQKCVVPSCFPEEFGIQRGGIRRVQLCASPDPSVRGEFGSLFQYSEKSLLTSLLGMARNGLKPAGFKNRKKRRNLAILQMFIQQIMYMVMQKIIYKNINAPRYRDSSITHFRKNPYLLLTFMEICILF